MTPTPPGTVGIRRRDRRTRPRRPRWRAWLLGLGITALALVAIAGAALLAGAWYVEEEALKKLAELGERAGLRVEASGVVIEPGSNVEVFGVVVADPEDDSVLLKAERIVTDLSFDDLRAGRRRPGEVILVGLEVDLSNPERWKRAMARFRKGGDHSAPAPRRSTLPEVKLAGATVHLPDPLGGPALLVKDVALHFAAGASEGERGKRWMALATGRLPGEQTAEITAWIDPRGDDHEVGATFDPPLYVKEGDLPAISVRGAYVHHRRTLRLSDVLVEAVPERRWLRADTIEVSGRRGDRVPEGRANVTLHGVSARWDGAEGSAAIVSTPLEAGMPLDLLGRLRGIVVHEGRVDVPDIAASLVVTRAHVDVHGVAEKQPLAKLQTIDLQGADISLRLPTADQARNIPYYRQIQGFLTGGAAPRGGGPASQDPVPNAGRLGTVRRLLGDARPTLKLRDGTLSLMVSGDDEPAFFIEQIDARVIPGEAGLAAEARVSGRLQELATGERGAFAVEAATGGDGGLQKARIKLSGSKLASQLARLSDSIRLSEASSLKVDLTITPHAKGRGLTATGTVGLSEMGFFAPRIHGTPVDGLEVEADLTVDFDPENDKITLDAPRIQVARQATLRLAATVEKLSAPLPTLDVRLQLPMQDCNGLVASIPPVMVPRLQGLTLSGTATAHLDFSVDLTQPRTYEHDLDVDMRNCRVSAFGNVDVRKLNRRFVHSVVEKGEELGVTVGPGTSHFRPLDRIPKHVQMGALQTEDHSFYRHSGFRSPLMRRAVVMNLEGGRYVYGGSTITQQLVKNLFLSREKTLTRKLEEAVIVWLIERYLTKDRILELYLNCIEYGPKIYGLQNAAQAYFGKDVEELNALDGAFLMGLKPYPWAGWQQFERGWVKPWWHRRLKKILTGMHKNGWITDEQLEASKSWEPRFLTSPPRPEPPPAAAPLDEGLPDLPADDPDGAQAPPVDGDAPPPTPNDLPVLIE